VADLIRRRAAVAIQRRWRLVTGLRARLAMLAQLSAAARRVTAATLYLDAWVFYLLLRLPKLPPVPPRLRTLFPEFRGTPAVHGPHAAFVCLAGDVQHACQRHQWLAAEERFAGVRNQEGSDAHDAFKVI
jgi:hypothetical protein